MSAISIIILFLAFLLLAAAGAGIFSWSLLTCAMVLSAMCLISCIKSKQAYHFRGCFRSPYFLLLLYLLLMLVPLPNLLHKASPIRARANQTATQHLQQIADTPDFAPTQSTGFSLSRNRSGTMRVLLLCIAGFSGWFLIRNAPCQTRERWLYAMVYMSAIMAIMGILGKWVFPQGNTLLWYIPVSQGRPGPMAGFMNRNHFAGYLAIMTPIAFVLANLARKRKRLLLASTTLFAAAILASGILLSLSRGGVLALLAGTGTLVLLYSRHQPIKRKCMILLASIAMLGSLTGTIWSHPSLRTRFLTWTNPATYASAQERLAAWNDSFAIFLAYPVLGAGPNAFRTVYPQHRYTSDRAARDFAENEYVQWCAESGIVGIIIACAFAYLILRRIHHTRKTHSGDDRELSYAAIGALVVAATHALVDFPLRLPLYAITLASLIALLWKPSAMCKTAPSIHAPCHALGLLIACLFIPFDLTMDAPGTIASAPPAKAAKALLASPTYPIVWRRLSALLWIQNTPASRKQAEAFLSQAAQYDPNNYVLWEALGDRRKALGDKSGANQAYQRVNTLRDWKNIPLLRENL